MPVFESRQYRIFKEEERIKGVPTTLYEKACVQAHKILPLSPPQKTEEKLKNAADFCHINAKPEQIFSFSVLFILLTFFPITILTFANLFGFHLLPFGY